MLDAQTHERRSKNARNLLNINVRRKNADFRGFSVSIVLYNNKGFLLLYSLCVFAFSFITPMITIT